MNASVEISFRLLGASMPFDHGYALYGALSRAVPALHELERLSLMLVRGLRAGDGTMHLGPDTRLRLRLPAGDIPLALPLAGKAILVGGHGLRVGAPEVRPLVPAPVLQARFVTIKKFDADPETFGAAVRRQLDALGVAGGRVQVGARRAVRIASVAIVGFGVTIFDLSDEDAMKVLEAGIGGRRRMGCGVFEGLSDVAARQAEAGASRAATIAASPERPG